MLRRSACEVCVFLLLDSRRKKNLRSTAELQEAVEMMEVREKISHESLASVEDSCLEYENTAAQTEHTENEDDME